MSEQNSTAHVVLTISNGQRTLVEYEIQNIDAEELYTYLSKLLSRYEYTVKYMKGAEGAI